MDCVWIARELGFEKSLYHGRMTTLTDTLTVALVLVLLIGSIALYLYTRIQQAEQKISLLESILLDLKMSSEVNSYSELPAHENGDVTEAYIPYSENYTVPSDTPKLTEVDQYKSVVADAINERSEEKSYDKSYDKSYVDKELNYESLNVKELQTLAKSRGITGITKKGQLIEALKTSDKPEEVDIVIEESNL